MRCAIELDGCLHGYWPSPFAKVPIILFGSGCRIIELGASSSYGVDV